MSIETMYFSCNQLSAKSHKKQPPPHGIKIKGADSESR